jgi:TIR domain
MVQPGRTAAAATSRRDLLVGTMRIFVSYRREDSAGWAGRLVDDLAERFGAANVFQDIHSIRPGMDFVDAINEILRKADYALVVIGPAWLSLNNEAGGRRLDDASDYVRVEVATALRHGSPVIPILVGGAKMPAPALLPDDIRPLARRNAAELTDRRWSYDLNQLALAISGSDRPNGRRWFASVSIGRWSTVLSVGVITGMLLLIVPTDGLFPPPTDQPLITPAPAPRPPPAEATATGKPALTELVPTPPLDRPPASTAASPQRGTATSTAYSSPPGAAEPIIQRAPGASLTLRREFVRQGVQYQFRLRLAVTQARDASATLNNLRAASSRSTVIENSIRTQERLLNSAMEDRGTLLERYVAQVELLSTQDASAVDAAMRMERDAATVAGLDRSDTALQVAKAQAVDLLARHVLLRRQGQLVSADITSVLGK